MKVAIIGAGGAGLAAARHCLQQDVPCDVFEQTGGVGGTWVYTDRVGSDENGLPVHSSMYQNLRTNLPKEVMAFEDFPYPEQGKSYIYQPEVLSYLQNFTKHFQLEPHIKFFKRTIKVDPLYEDRRWRIEIEDVKTKLRDVRDYDAVFVCSGHYTDPFIPDIEDIDGYSGGVTHSHDYRSAEPFRNKTVLVIGANPSGYDISRLISAVARKVFISHNNSQMKSKISHEMTQKPLVKRIAMGKVEFEDATVEDIDEILFCTGYHYSFPFLTSNCKVKIDDSYVYPLYKQVINIENPTMAFIGLPFRICPFPMFDIQVRFFLAYLANRFDLPPKTRMLHELEQIAARKRESGIPQRHFHLVGVRQAEYFNDLADTAGIKRTPPVISKLFYRVQTNRNLNDRFKLIDSEDFLQII